MKGEGPVGRDGVLGLHELHGMRRSAIADRICAMHGTLEIRAVDWIHGFHEKRKVYVIHSDTPGIFGTPEVDGVHGINHVAPGTRSAGS